MVTIRRVTQGAFLLLFFFLFLQTAQKGVDTLGYPVKLFLDFDPLLMISTLLSSHAVPAAFLLSLILLAVTAVLGRVFCGWICPLGTLNNMVGAMRRWPKAPRTRNWFRLKYYILAFLLASSLFTLQVTGVVDPLCLTVRSFSLGLFPAFNAAVNAGLDALYAVDLSWITAAADASDAFLKKTMILAFHQPHFLQGVLIGSLFLGVLALNLVERRFWCRYLCPLGALLGVCSRYALLKRTLSEGCTACSLCDDACQGNARPGEEGTWKPAECLYCWNCANACPTNGASFGFSARKAPAGLDLSRRRVVLAAASGAAAIALLKVSPVFKGERANPSLIRPPGALEESGFLEKCVKCGECMKVCTTNGLQPVLLEAGLEGIWSPMLVPRIGYCEYRCTLCGQVCPTGAIERLPLEEKMKVRIGLATIDRSRCLPYAHATPCIVCEEVCPTPTKAIWFEALTVRRRDGSPVDVKQPHVDLDLCIGCGICENKCPVTDRPAITVTSLGESRSPDNQLLIS